MTAMTTYSSKLPLRRLAPVLSAAVFALKV
jgi:hypothetical protein